MGKKIINLLTFYLYQTSDIFSPSVQQNPLDVFDSMLLTEEPPGREDWEEKWEVAMDKVQSLQVFFLENDILLVREQAEEQTPFKLCRAQLQLR